MLAPHPCIHFSLWWIPRGSDSTPQPPNYYIPIIVFTCPYDILIISLSCCLRWLNVTQIFPRRATCNVLPLVSNCSAVFVLQEVQHWSTFQQYSGIACAHIFQLAAWLTNMQCDRKWSRRDGVSSDHKYGGHLTHVNHYLKVHFCWQLPSDRIHIDVPLSLRCLFVWSWVTRSPAGTEVSRQEGSQRANAEN